jgi:hypothetical protein
VSAAPSRWDCWGCGGAWPDEGWARARAAGVGFPLPAGLVCTGLGLVTLVKREIAMEFGVGVGCPGGFETESYHSMPDSGERKASPGAWETL